MSFFDLKLLIKNKQYLMFFLKNKINKYPRINRKRTLSSTFIKGGMTLEAAILVPLILILMVIFMTPLLILKTQISIQENLNNCALKMSKISFANIYMDKGSDSSTKDILNSVAAQGFSLLYAGNEIKNLSLCEELDNSLISSDSFMLNPVLSNIDVDNGIINLVVTYKISIPFLKGKTTGITSSQKCRIRSYSGMDISEATDNIDFTVYQTATGGRVYHRHPYCSYLLNYITVPIRSKFLTEIEHEGRFYYLCSYCKRNNYDNYNFVYITKYGECFHTSLDCHILSTNVFAIKYSKLSSIATPCSRCYKK